MQQTPEVIQAKQRFGIVGNAPALVAAIERTLRVAPIDLSVLIIGESGTGKEFFPKIIHQYSKRKHAKYIAVNCGAIPEGTIDSELFGHEKGSFTGAVSARKGYFEEADGGTIFLDEVAELPLTTQARLLRVLETGEFLKVGSSVVQKTNIRVVAATNVDMQKAVREGRFREDLYYRLSTVQIYVPPLRDRGNDIALLARKFAGDFAERWRLPEITLADDARSALFRYRWPGNVRQLKNVIEQVSIFEAGKEIDAAKLREYLPTNAGAPGAAIVARDRSYESEREMLMGLIIGLQRRIEELEEKLGDAGVHASKLAEPMANIHLKCENDSFEDIHSNTLRTSRSLVNHFRMPEPNIVEDADFTPYVETEPEAAMPATMREREREAIREALERNHGHRKAAADELQISQRTLYRKIKEYDLE